MEIMSSGSSYMLTCDRYELSLIAEGLYAVEITGRNCLNNDVPDELDRFELEAEIERLADMRSNLSVALGE